MRRILAVGVVSLATALHGALPARAAQAAIEAEVLPAPDATQRRVHEEVQRLLLRLVESGELSAQAAEELSLLAPASRMPDFGAVLDVRHRSGEDRGLEILAVTPGSSAAAMGLLAGDRLLSVDGVSLLGLGADGSGRAVAAERLREALVSESGEVRLELMRGRERQTVSGPVKVVELPAYRLELGAALANASLAAGEQGDGESRCGRISVLDMAPRSKRLYRAVLIAIDGASPGPSQATSFRVEPGRHVLTVAEAISDGPARLSARSGFAVPLEGPPIVDASSRSPMRLNHRGTRGGEDRYRMLEIDVQPGVTYRLAAQLRQDRREVDRDGDFWEPVIWKEVRERCR